MRKSITSRIAIAGVAALALGLGACGSDAGTPDPTGGETTQAEATEDAEAPAEPVTLEYMHRLPDGEGMVPVADIVARWNEEHPDIQVKTTKFDGAAQEMIVKLETDIKAGAGVCLAQVGYGEVPDLREGPHGGRHR